MKTWEKAFVAALWILSVSILLAVALGAQEKKVNPYQPSEVQALKLQVKQRDAMIAQKDLLIAQQNFQAAIQALANESVNVRIENKWPTNLNFNQQTLEFSAPLEVEKK